MAGASILPKLVLFFLYAAGRGGAIEGISAAGTGTLGALVRAGVLQGGQGEAAGLGDIEEQRRRGEYAKIDEASDDVRTWFSDESCSLQAHDSVITGERATAIFATTPEKLASILALRA